MAMGKIKRSGKSVKPKLTAAIQKEIKKDIKEYALAVPARIGKTVLPKTMSRNKTVIFKWTECTLLTGALGVSLNQYRVNSPYGPDHTAATETQAYGWDQTVSVTNYRRYMVTHFRYRVECYDSDINCYVGIKLHYDGTSMGNPITVFHAVPNLKFRSSHAGAGSKVSFKSKWLAVDRVLGRKLDPSQDQGLYSGHPTVSNPMMTVYAIDPLLTTTPAAKVFVHIEFKTNLSDSYQHVYS